jgi:hypothetical protein
VGERCGKSYRWAVDVLSLWAELELRLSWVKVVSFWVMMVVVGSYERNQKSVVFRLGVVKKLHSWPMKTRCEGLPCWE